jgi:hypothetical protein
MEEFSPFHIDVDLRLFLSQLECIINEKVGTGSRLHAYSDGSS